MEEAVWLWSQVCLNQAICKEQHCLELANTYSPQSKKNKMVSKKRAERLWSIGKRFVLHAKSKSLVEWVWWEITPVLSETGGPVLFVGKVVNRNSFAVTSYFQNCAVADSFVGFFGTVVWRDIQIFTKLVLVFRHENVFNFYFFLHRKHCNFTLSEEEIGSKR